MTATEKPSINKGGIVFLTVPGDIKHHFAKRLDKHTGHSLRLVIIQRKEQKSVFQRIKYLYKRVGLRIFKEIWYATLLRLDKSIDISLRYFREHSFKQKSINFENTLEVTSVNSDEVYNTLKEISPDLLVVWGGTIIEPRIIATAKKAINLHFGLCPYYLGALANQHAVILDDYSNIGATIHHIEPTADTGDILAVIKADTNKNPRYLFADLNDQAMDQFLEIATKMFYGKEISVTLQDNSHSNILYLREWVPSVRYKLGKKIINWEKGIIKV